MWTERWLQPERWAHTVSSEFVLLKKKTRSRNECVWLTSSDWKTSCCFFFVHVPTLSRFHIAHTNTRHCYSQWHKKWNPFWNLQRKHSRLDSLVAPTSKNKKNSLVKIVRVFKSAFHIFLLLHKEIFFNRLAFFFFFKGLEMFDYAFTENGIQAYKDGKLYHSKVCVIIIIAWQSLLLILYSFSPSPKCTTLHILISFSIIELRLASRGRELRTTVQWDFKET